MSKKLDDLNKKIIDCKKCSRLTNFREKIAFEKTKRFSNENYWGKPVIGFGDVHAKIIILGLAPAAHGGNRTGRVFTGDKSADFLFKCLYKAKMSNKSTSKSLNDGLKLTNIYMTPVLKCVPPNDKPTSDELNNCFSYLIDEFQILVNAKILLALGKVAFDSCLKLFGLKRASHKFIHGKCYQINKNLKCSPCYHLSAVGCGNPVCMEKITVKEVYNALLGILKLK